MAGALNLLRCNVCRPAIQVFWSVRNSCIHSTNNSIASRKLLQYSDLNPQVTNIRSTETFLARTTAEYLWKSMTSVSAAGRKKGRAKGLKKRVKDLNRGQVIGFGDKNMLWPGLNAPVIRGHEVLRQQELPPDESRKQRLIELRTRVATSRMFKIHPLERGWSGTKLPGRSLGPPDPVADEKFEGFDSRVLVFRNIFKMTGSRGRIRITSAFVVVGNKKGLAGYGLAKSPNGMTAANCAKNRAAKALRHIPLEDNRTVLHSFSSTFGPITIFVKKPPEGYGLVCHRAIRSICQVIGIKDLYAKVIGPTDNVLNVTKTFFLGLIHQKPLSEYANEKGLHLVELTKNRDYYPVVVASPPKCRTKKEIDPHENMDFNIHTNGGKVEAPRKKFEPFYINYPSYIKAMKDKERFRNHHDVKIHLAVKYGEVTSFLQIREKEKAKSSEEAMANT